MLKKCRLWIEIMEIHLFWDNGKILFLLGQINSQSDEPTREVCIGAGQSDEPTREVCIGAGQSDGSISCNNSFLPVFIVLPPSFKSFLYYEWVKKGWSIMYAKFRLGGMKISESKEGFFSTVIFLRNSYAIKSDFSTETNFRSNLV